eukprot:5126340-Amphidinium_carterae.1
MADMMTVRTHTVQTLQTKVAPNPNARPQANSRKGSDQKKAKYRDGETTINVKQRETPEVF